MKGAYYNEHDPFAAGWLRALIAAGHLPAGDVDERSIADVRPDDLVGYTQVHFFAGIGGWPLALRLAGTPDDAPVWTGSCPCQPFSVAGKGRGADDERHLWPEMRRLVAECRPAIVLGEQVAGRAGLDWLCAVRLDLEGLGYAVGAADLCAAGVGAPHLRQRLYWGAVADAGRRSDERRPTVGDDPSAPGPDASAAPQRERGRAYACGGSSGGDARAAHGGWADADWLGCRDDRWRPVEPGTFPLADGIPARVGRLRGYGNAIVPQVAAAFVTALLG